MKAGQQRSLTFLWLGLLLLPASARLSAQPAATTATKHSLWKAQGRTNAVYLFGSIHFLTKKFYPLPAPIEEAYKQSQIVAFETDIDDANSSQTQLKMLQAAKFPDGQTLRQHVSKETYAQLESYLTKAVGTGAAFDSFRPWMAAVALYGLELQKLGLNPEEGVDRYFFNKSKKDAKEIVPLETIDFQLSLFTALSQEDQDAMLKESLEEIGNFKKDINEVIEAWRTGNTSSLERLILDTILKYSTISKKLLTDRNKQWSEKIQKLFNEGKNVFVVVGTAHLVGKDSLVDLLSKKGLKLQQL